MRKHRQKIHAQKKINCQNPKTFIFFHCFAFQRAKRRLPSALIHLPNRHAETSAKDTRSEKDKLPESKDLYFFPLFCFSTSETTVAQRVNSFAEPPCGNIGKRYTLRKR